MIPKWNAGVLIQTRRTYATVKLNPPELYENGGSEITLYIKGFLSKNEQPANFRHWFNSHKIIAHEKGWSELAKGWYWDCGKFQYSVPIATGINTVHSIYKLTKYLKFNPWSFAAAAAVDVGVFFGSVLYEYYRVENNIHEISENLAKDLLLLRERYGKVRIVAHSLGCKLYLNSLRHIHNSETYSSSSLSSSSSSSSLTSNRYNHHYDRNNNSMLPDEVHLCAAAMLEKEYEDVLRNGVARDTTYVYYTERDAVLSSLLYYFKNESPVGSIGLYDEYPKIRCVDTSSHFTEWIVHNRYSSQLPSFVQPYSAIQNWNSDRLEQTLSSNQPAYDSHSYNHNNNDDGSDDCEYDVSNDKRIYNNHTLPNTST